MKRAILGLSLGLFALGCSVDAGTAACNALVEAYVTRLADDCALGTRDQIYQGIEYGLRQQGITCASIDDVADPEVFYMECIPDIEILDCAEATMELPETCEGQLLIRR